MVENKKELNHEELKQEDLDKISGGRFGIRLSEEDKKEQERKRQEERRKNGEGATGSW